MIMSRVMIFFLDTKEKVLLEGNLDDGIKKTKLSYKHLWGDDWL